jgi:hypothetical protein
MGSWFRVLYPMFTADHSWLSRQFSMCVLCILFFFVLCILSNVSSCPFLVVSSGFYVRTKTNKIHNTSIENRRDNQEWAAINIGYNTQNDEKQNTQRLRSVYCIQCHNCPFLVVPSVFYVCVVYFVFRRSVYCIQCL